MLWRAGGGYAGEGVNRYAERGAGTGLRVLPAAAYPARWRQPRPGGPPHDRDRTGARGHRPHDTRETALQALFARRALWDGTAAMLRERCGQGRPGAVEPASPTELNLMRRIGELNSENVAAVTP